MTTRTESPAPSGLAVGHSRDTQTLVGVALASVMLPLTVTGPAVALSHLAAALGSGVGAAQWVQNAYGVTFAAFLLAAGGLADRYGRRRTLVVGVVLFTAMSAICGLATNMLEIDIARALQGVGAAGILTAGAAILSATFRDARRPRAFGVLGASFGCGLALGPVVAGGLVAGLGWRSVFLLNVPLGIVVLLLVGRVAESRDPDASGVDWAGMAAFSVSLALLALAFVQGPTNGWGSVQALGSLIGSALAMGVFVAIERRVRRPMFDLSLFLRPTFVAVVCQPFTITFGFVVLLVYLPPYFQGVGGRNSVAAGAMLLPLTVPVLVLPLVAGYVATRVPLRFMLATSSLLIAAGSLWLVTLQPGRSWLGMLGPLGVFGVGVGSAFGVMDNAAVSVAPPERSGMASGIFNTMRITGESVAIAGAGALLSSLTLHNLAHGTMSGSQASTLAGDATQGRLQTDINALPSADRAATLHAVSNSLTSAMHVAFIVLAVLALAGAGATFAAVRDRELQR